MTTFSAPADCLNIGNGSTQNYFNVGVGTPKKHIDYGLQDIAKGLIVPKYFEMNADRTRVRFTAHLDGARTSKNTKYPRTELRELTRDGKRASWSADKGTHSMAAELAIMHIAPGKPEFCVAQIHDDEDDTLQLRLERRRLFVTVNEKDSGTLTSDYTMGTPFQMAIVVEGKRVAVIYEGRKAVDRPFRGGGQYFKIGAYAQSNTSHDDADETMVVEVGGLVVRHIK